jgi:hypothetical protein
MHRRRGGADLRTVAVPVCARSMPGTSEVHRRSVAVSSPAAGRSRLAWPYRGAPAVYAPLASPESTGPCSCRKPHPCWWEPMHG